VRLVVLMRTDMVRNPYGTSENTYYRRDERGR